MKITRRQLRGIINEALLLELFDSPPYDSKIDRDATINDSNRKTVFFTYVFTTKIENSLTPELAEEESYVVTINAYNPQDPWNVAFRTYDGDFLESTLNYDVSVFSTIVAIVKDFVKNQLPNLENERMRHIRTFEVEPTAAEEGDTRRLRLYQRMLRNYGINSQNIDNKYLEFQV